MLNHDEKDDIIRNLMLSIKFQEAFYTHTLANKDKQIEELNARIRTLSPKSEAPETPRRDMKELIERIRAGRKEASE